ncbi:MAG: EamA family transporter [Clostridia bacterium]|nr:EamA family transporter [Clostridia bacterium]
MSWFFYALICLFGWGLADLFYKKGTDENDSLSHLKIAVWVGLVMGAVAFALIPFSETGFSFKGLIVNALKYSPASLSYIISMVVGYAGLRYLEVSIISPIQNASGAFSMIAMFIFFLVTGTVNDDLGDFSPMNVIGTVLIIAGVVALAIVENRLSAKESSESAKTEEEKRKVRKLRYSALALIFPLIYCLFDTVGTAADGIILDEETGLGLGEIDVLILYGLTFLLAGIGCYVFMWIKTRKPYNPFAVKELTRKGVAACFEEFGQIFYVFAMARNPMFAAPMVASYCIVSVILSRIFLREKLKLSQYGCVALVIAGIMIMGISEGLAEAA